MGITRIVTYFCLTSVSFQNSHVVQSDAEAIEMLVDLKCLEVYVRTFQHIVFLLQSKLENN